MSIKDKVKKEDKEKEVDNIDFFVADVGNSQPSGLSKPSKGSSIVNIIDSLQSVDVKSPDAQANEGSISDNNGDRIELNDDPASPNVIKK